MRRRNALAWTVAATLSPFGAAAETDRVRKVGFLGANTPAAAGHLTTAFLTRLRELGWVENRDFVVEYRWAGGQTAKFREAATELAAAHVDVIVTSGTAPTVAAMEVAATTPIVMASSGDLIRAGLVKSLARPGGNVTGMTFAPEDTAGKRLELLKEAVPRLTAVGILANPDANPGEVQACRAAAPSLGLSLQLFDFRDLADLRKIAAPPTRAALGGLFVVSDPLVFTHRVAIGEFAIAQKLPTIHRLREYAADGGLLSYGPSFPEFFRRAAEYVDKILRGAKPADLPVEQPTTFEFVVNLKTARAIGLTMPQTILLRANEVIE